LIAADLNAGQNPESPRQIKSRSFGLHDTTRPGFLTNVPLQRSHFSSQLYTLVWLVPIAIIFILFAYTRARSSAARYGEQVKATFDIYLPQLAQKLGFALSQDAEKNRTFWQAYSRLMVYRDQKAVKEMFAVGLNQASKGTTEPGEESSNDDDE
jgi:hypothetical protein